MEEKAHYENKTDPSELTTQTIWREVGALKELLLAHIDRIDTAVKVAHNDQVRFPTDIEKAVASLKELLLNELKSEHALKEEKFNSVNQRFNLIEASRIEQKSDSTLRKKQYQSKIKAMPLHLQKAKQP